MSISDEELLLKDCGKYPQSNRANFTGKISVLAEGEKKRVVRVQRDCQYLKIVSSMLC